MRENTYSEYDMPDNKKLEKMKEQFFDLTSKFIDDCHDVQDPPLVMTVLLTYDREDEDTIRIDAGFLSGNIDIVELKEPLATLIELEIRKQLDKRRRESMN